MPTWMYDVILGLLNQRCCRTWIANTNNLEVQETLLSSCFKGWSHCVQHAIETHQTCHCWRWETQLCWCLQNLLKCFVLLGCEGHHRSVAGMSPTFFFLCIVAYGVLLQTCALNDRLLIEPEQKNLGGVQRRKKEKTWISFTCSPDVHHSSLWLAAVAYCCYSRFTT